MTIAEGRFRIEPLADHDRATFASGVPALDRYFRQQAGQEHRRRVATVFVAVESPAGEPVAGFYTLSAASVHQRDLPPEVARRMPRYPDLPAILLGRLAVDARWQGQGVGRLLVTDALLRCARLDQIGALVLFVEAKDAAAADFYIHLGFQPLSDQAQRLFFVLEDLRRTLRQA